MGDLLSQWRQKSRDAWFMLSVYGLCLMLLPLVIVLCLQHLEAVSQLTWNTELREIGIRFRGMTSFIGRSEPLMIGLGVVSPCLGLGLVVISWSSVLIGRFKSPAKTPVNKTIPSNQ